jgi:hypothetical protein
VALNTINPKPSKNYFKKIIISLFLYVMHPGSGTVIGSFMPFKLFKSIDADR